jgi:putative ABC transport system permease protein
MFAVAGIFMVTSLLVLVMANSDQIIGFLTKLLRVKGGYIAVVKTAISYPLKAKFRTALSIFIFGLVIFTVTVLSMMSGVLAVGIPNMISETSGGFDVVGFTNPSNPVTTDLWDQIKENKGLLHSENVTNVIPLVNSVPSFIKGNIPGLDQNATYDTFRYNTIGVNSRFYTEGDYPLKEWNTSLYASSLAAWQAVQADPSLCVIDGSGSNQLQYGMGEVSSITGLKVGDQITMVISNGGAEPTTKVLTVVGIMKQSFFSGVFVNEDLVKNELMSPYPTIFLVKIAPGVDVDRQAILLEKDFLKYNMNTISMSSMAKEATSQIDGMFNLLKAFLAMGLIIGISGLGIITIRSINERRVEIGMMRAIGYTRRMVVANFAMESAFISIIGIVGGSLLGIIVGYSLWETAFQPMGMEFVIAWWPIVLVGAAAFVATVLSVYPAARGASRVSPAEVLRFE